MKPPHDVLLHRFAPLNNDVPLVEGRPTLIDISSETDRIRFGYDPASFRSDRSSWVEIRLKTRSAAELARLLAGEDDLIT